MTDLPEKERQQIFERNEKKRKETRLAKIFVK